MQNKTFIRSHHRLRRTMG